MSIYGRDEISERHRHRYEFNPDYQEIMASHGLIFSGKSRDERFLEMIELRDHPWFLGCQFHPEYRSKPLEPHPLFVSFIRAAYRHRQREEAAKPEEEVVRVEAELVEFRKPAVVSSQGDPAG